ncbi:hypothetical protein AeNC1_000433 [Aphanomyces euteiches]|nr:hypothetical protein AeNC1_000433 [Aphanomyces euteiches]
MADVDKLLRLLRPIYDAIDARQYKNAIKLCSQKKICDIDLVQVLQAHCLERTGKVDEALRIVRRVQLNKPTDENLLSTMQLVFKLCGVPQEMLSTYEHAASVQPTNQDMNCQLFYGYARALSLAKQQQLAFKMAKNFNSLQYVGWACLSMLLQVTVEKSLPVKMLPLADKMLTKSLREHPKEWNGELGQLLVLLLQAQDKPQEAMAAFQEFIHIEDDQKNSTDAPAVKPRSLEGEGVPDDEIELGPMQAIDRKVLEASLAHDIQDWSRCVTVYTDLLTNYNADDWAFWLGLIEASFKLESPEALTHLHTTVDSLQTLHGVKFRGPYLAAIEIAHRNPKSKAAFVTDFIVPYMDRFKSKTCCVTDLQRYIVDLDESAKTALIAASHERLKEALAKQDANGDEKEQQLWFKQALLARKMLRYLGEHLTPPIDELLGRVETMLQEYHGNQWLNGTAVGGQREVQVTDDLLLLTVLLLVDVYTLADSSKFDAATRRSWLLQAATCLEFGLSRSAYNFQMKLLLCRIYARLGAGSAMFARYQELDIKQIQMDSLSYLILDPLLALGQFDEAVATCDAVRALHRTTARDTPEFIARAYRLGVLSKAQDMTSFLLHKMKRSQMLALATAERVHANLVELTRTSTTHLQNQFAIQPLPLLADLEEFVAQADNLSANHHREIEVKWTLDSHNEGNGRYIYEESTFSTCDRTTDEATLKQWLHLRVCVPRLVGAALEGKVSDVTAHANTFKTLVQDVSGPAASLWTIATTAAEAVALIAESTTDFASGSALLDEVAAQLKTVNVFESMIHDKLLKAHGLSLASVWLYQVSPYVLMFLALIAKQVKPKKKAKDAAATKACFEHVKQCIQAHLDLNQRGLAICKKFKPDVHVPDHTVVQEAVETVKTKVVEAQSTVTARFHTILTDHVSFLRSI